LQENSIFLVFSFRLKQVSSAARFLAWGGADAGLHGVANTDREDVSSSGVLGPGLVNNELVPSLCCVGEISLRSMLWPAG